MAFRLWQLLALGGSAGAGWGYCRREAEVAQIHPHKPERFAFTQIHSNSFLKQRKGLVPHNFPPHSLAAVPVFKKLRAAWESNEERG